MNIDQIVFDEDMEMHVVIEMLNSNVRLVLSDGLYAFEEELSAEYKEKIVAFIKAASVWYQKAAQAVLSRGQQTYNLVAAEDIKLQSIFILFEQNEPPLFGLSFRTEFDTEHGCGIKVGGDDFDIVAIGTADVAFC